MRMKLNTLPPKLLIINDISGVGRCSMSVSLPVVSACKVQGIPVPTSVFSNHTGFPTHLKIDLTGQLKDYFAALNTLSMNWDGIYCGYLGAKEQLHAISHYYDSLTEKPLFIIDPVMGDYGRAYQHITPEFCHHMKDFVSRGDIITPNLTEACLLTDTPYPEHDCTDPELSAISKKLHALGVKKCIITGCPKGDTFLNYISDSRGNVDTVSTKKAGPGYPGTGDIFVSIVSALTLRGFSLQECTTQAAHFIASCISYSQSLSNDTLQGVIFEPLLSDLVSL